MVIPLVPKEVSRLPSALNLARASFEVTADVLRGGHSNHYDLPIRLEGDDGVESLVEKLCNGVTTDAKTRV